MPRYAQACIRWLKTQQGTSQTLEIEFLGLGLFNIFELNPLQFTPTDTPTDTPTNTQALQKVK